MFAVGLAWDTLPTNGRLARLQKNKSASFIRKYIKKNSDSGYRYQQELADDGINDQKDTRISSLDDSTLVVQAAVLPILE
jgi:Fe-S cluster assembly iron-binding protein IscA